MTCADYVRLAEFSGFVQGMAWSLLALALGLAGGWLIGKLRR